MVQALPLIIAGASAVGGIAQLVSKPATPKLPAALPQPQHDDAIDALRSGDALRKRRGGAADLLTGTGGAEASAAATGKDTLGS